MGDSSKGFMPNQMLTQVTINGFLALANVLVTQHQHLVRDLEAPAFVEG
jgi:hypothetical protein